MSKKSVKELLRQLHEEIESADAVDAETVALLRELDTEIHELLDVTNPKDDAESVFDRATALEANFSATHPTAGRFVREIIEALGKMGI